MGSLHEKVRTETTIGYKRLLRLEELITNSIQIRILDAKGPPVLSKLGIYFALTEPEIISNTD